MSARQSSVLLWLNYYKKVQIFNCFYHFYSSRYPGTKTTHAESNQKETTSMWIICTGNNIFLQFSQKKIMNAVT